MKRSKSSSFFMTGDAPCSEMTPNEEFLLHQIHKLKSEITELRTMIENLEVDKGLWFLRFSKRAVISTNVMCACFLFAYRLSSDLQYKYQAVTFRRVLLDRKRVASETPIILYNAVLRATLQSVFFFVSAYLLKRRESQLRNLGCAVSIALSSYLTSLPRIQTWPLYINIAANLAHLFARFYYFLPRIVNSAPGL
eukprot:ANDGO_06834.mRNA.1 hypothetical protein DICPUDRAFT_97067